MKKTYFSKRIYKSELSCDCIAAITESIRLFNRAKHFAFQTLVREARLHKKLFSKSLHLVLKDKYGMSDYYRNSICREANALFTSQMELCKLYVKQTEEKIKHLKKKITKERKFLTQFINIKQSFIKGQLQLPRNLRFSVHEKGVVSYTYKKETRIWWNTYLFEHQYITPMIKQTKASDFRIAYTDSNRNKKSRNKKRKVSSLAQRSCLKSNIQRKNP